MNNRGKSFLGGAAVAALLILPAAAANGDWTVWPTKTFSGNGVRVTDIVGTLTVNVRDGGPVTVDVSGTRPRVNGVSVHQEDGTVVIDGSNSSENGSVWDWHKWFNFSVNFNTTAPGACGRPVPGSGLAATTSACAKAGAAVAKVTISTIHAATNTATKRPGRDDDR